MKTLPALVCLVVLSGAAAQGQTQEAPPQPSQPASSSASAAASPTPKTVATPVFNAKIPSQFEISFGYTFRSYSGALGRVSMDGAYGSADYNIFRWLGATGEVVGVYRKIGSQSLGTQQTYALATAMGGPQFYPLFHHKLTPFVHVLAGVGGLHFYAPAYAGFPERNQNSEALAYEEGAGVDLRIKAHWSVRLIEADYGSTSFPGTHGGQSSTRFSAGLVYLRGQK